jgi:hypothetical protein
MDQQRNECIVVIASHVIARVLHLQEGDPTIWHPLSYITLKLQPHINPMFSSLVVPSWKEVHRRPPWV